MRRVFFHVSLVCVLLPCLAARPAHGAPAPSTRSEAGAEAEAARALSLQSQGAELAEQGHDEEAAALLRESWVTTKDPATAALLGACEVKLGQFRAAAEHLAFALGAEASGEERARQEALYHQATAKVGHLDIVVNVDGATVLVGDVLMRQSPLEGGVFVDPGEVTVIAKKAGLGEVQQTVTIAAGASGRVEIHLPADAPAPAREVASPSLIPAFVLGGVAVAAAGVGAGLYAAGASKGSDADDELAVLVSRHGPAPCAAGGGRPADCDALKSDRTSSDRLVNAGTGLLIGAGATLGVAVIYGVLSQSPPPTQMGRLAVSPLVSRAGGGVWMQGRF